MIRHARMHRPADAVPARPRPCLDRRPVRPRPDPRQGGREPAVARSRALPRADVAFIDETREVMLGQQRRVGASFDWGRLRFTMDEGSAKAVRVAFNRLYRDGLAYRDRGARQLVPGLPDERVATSRSSRRPRPARSGRSATTSSTRRRPSPIPDATISVATTRPETILGDTAVAVHPDDPRYRGARRPRGPDPVRRARRADHRRRGRSSASSGRAPSRSRRPTTTTTTRPAGATACR